MCLVCLFDCVVKSWLPFAAGQAESPELYEMLLMYKFAFIVGHPPILVFGVSMPEILGRYFNAPVEEGWFVRETALAGYKHVGVNHVQEGCHSIHVEAPMQVWKGGKFREVLQLTL